MNTTRHRTLRTAHRRLAMVGIIVGCTACVFVFSGCRRSLFMRNELRHQFQAYEISRDEYVPLQVPDVFGNPQPALRARLAPDS